MLQLSLNRPGEHLFVRAASADAITVVDRTLTTSFVLAADRADFATIAGQLAESAKAETVQTIGRTAVYYRKNPDEPKLALPR